MLVDEDGEYYAVNEIVVKGDAEGFAISIPEEKICKAKDVKEPLIQVTDMVCQGLAILLERQEGQRMTQVVIQSQRIMRQHCQ